MLRFEVDDRAILDVLGELSARMQDLTEPMSDIGEHLVETTKRRFDTSTAPDGSRWEPNSDVTILRYLGAYKSSFKRDGTISKKGTSRLQAKKPLVGETRSLMSTINYVPGRDHVYIGSPEIYAGVQQFGAHAKEFGKSPWGDIPARPFLGLSDDDSGSILDILASYLSPP